MDQAVQVWREGRAGRIRLHRPKAFNALTLAMLQAIHAAVDAFSAEPDVHFLLIDAPERGFCAGGDVRGIRAGAMAGDRGAARIFFSAEYALNQAIAECRKPVVALVDGVCMGGGIGISVHGSHRIATERAMFAMPETAIGLFPDVGTSFLLPRLPGWLGLYMGLTGARMVGADAVHAGLATHFVQSKNLPALAAAMVQDGVAVIAALAEPLPAFSLAAARPLDRRGVQRPLGSGHRGAAGAGSHKLRAGNAAHAAPEFPQRGALEFCPAPRRGASRLAPGPGGGAGAGATRGVPAGICRGRARRPGGQGPRAELAAGAPGGCGPGRDQRAFCRYASIARYSSTFGSATR